MLALIGAAVLSCGIILILPLTQLIQDPAPPFLEFREVVTTELPPPPPPPPKQTIAAPESAAVPQLSSAASIENMAFTPLDIKLNPGIGDALAMGAQPYDFETEIDVIAAIQHVFTFADLNEVPHVISTPRFSFPRRLTRRGITSGNVVLLIEIDTRGRAKVLEILSSSHELLEPVAEKIVRESLFSIPKVDGKLQTVRGEWPIYLNAPQ